MKRLALLLIAVLGALAAPASACTHTGVAAVACPECNAYATPQALPVQAADDCEVQQAAVPVQTYATVRVVQRQYVGLPAVRALPVRACAPQQAFAVQQFPVQSYHATQAFPVTATPVFGSGYGYGGVNTFGVGVGTGYNRGFRTNGFGLNGGVRHNGFGAGAHHGASVGAFAGNGFVGAGAGGGTVNINARKFKVKRSQLNGLFNSGNDVNINAKKFKVKRSQFN
jgi:hypothetical protein